MPYNTDTQYRESVISKIKESESGYEIESDGWTCFCPKAKGLPPPQAGEMLRLYGKGLGHTIRGIVVDGRIYKYLTEEQENKRHEEWCREQQAKREKELADNLAETERRISALPQVFRERIEKFQHDGGHKFRRDYEGYELFCCEQAVIIAEALHTSEAIKSFHDEDWETQKRIVSGLSDGHSGNTFGVSCRLALIYVERPEFVAKIHGALTPLVGCDAYGCKHP